MKYFEIPLTRSSETELKSALQEKIDDGWELSLDITPIMKTGKPYEINKKICGSYTVTKYMCRVRKEERLLRQGRKVN